jgi:tetratricopeptide (TPR) repeat protein
MAQIALLTQGRDPIASARALEVLGDLQLMISDGKGAEKSLRRAVALDPSRNGAWEALAMVLKSQGRPEAAIPVLKEWVKRDKTPRAGHILIQIYGATEAWDEALVEADILLKTEPDDFKMNWMRAVLLLKRRDDAATLKEASDILHTLKARMSEEIPKLGDEAQQDYERLATCGTIVNALNGHRETAGAAFERLLAMNAENKAARKALAALKEGMPYGRQGLKATPGKRDWELFVSSYNTNEVLCFDGATQRFLGSFAAKELQNPQGIAFGLDGNLYVTSFTNQVLRFDSRTGKFLDVFASGGGLTHPVEIAFGPDSNLYVASYDSHQVLRYNGKTGAFMDAFVTAGSGGLNHPHGLTFGPDGDLYVTSDPNRVLRYDGKSGAFLHVFVTQGLNSPSALCFQADGSLCVVNSGLSCVQRYGKQTGVVAEAFAKDEKLQHALGLLIGPDGDLYVSGWESSNVMRFDGKTGQFREEFVRSGGEGLRQGQFMAWRFLPERAPK